MGVPIAAKIWTVDTFARVRRARPLDRTIGRARWRRASRRTIAATRA